ncbi:MAG: hypothetical protein K5905_04625 [Roseibium sp.]|uniref:hypothetical protein n=1 Tax=Roseibium sp. TaxID=1936156 RepID=UPI002604481B|nr:hypothetical protein [Roseibium sp.]MCV0424732.1 hypothetical protein [Roseibium sp.]
MRGHQVFLRFFLALLVAGCTPTGQNFLTHGPGARLEAGDMTTARELNRKYFNYLCQEAGINPNYDYGEPANNCIIDPYDKNAWTLITYQGLNDIDRRCDSYLQWLDNKKRSKGPLISQIGTVSAATTSIMNITGATAGAITIAGLAFELLSKSVENYHSRLLLEVDSSTINSIVLNARRKFREQLLTANLEINNKPQTEHILRSYLRLCLPFSIEANINNFSTLGSAGISPSNENIINWTPASAPSIRANTTVNTKVTRPQRVSAPGWQAVSNITIDLPTAKAIQSALCLPQTEIDGVYGPKTEAGLKIFESIQNTKGFSESDWQNRNVNLDGDDINILRRVASCSTGAMNYLENQLLNRPETSEKVAIKIRDKFEITDTNQSFPELRDSIRQWRTEENLNSGPGGVFANQVTPDLMEKMFRAF